MPKSENIVTKGAPRSEEDGPETVESARPLSDKVETFPYLVRIELLACIIVMVVLTVWSLPMYAPRFCASWG